MIINVCVFVYTIHILRHLPPYTTGVWKNGGSFSLAQLFLSTIKTHYTQVITLDNEKRRMPRWSSDTLIMTQRRAILKTMFHVFPKDLPHLTEANQKNRSRQVSPTCSWSSKLCLGSSKPLCAPNYCVVELWKYTLSSLPWRKNASSWSLKIQQH